MPDEPIALPEHEHPEEVSLSGDVDVSAETVKYFRTMRAATDFINIFNIQNVNIRTNKQNGEVQLVYAAVNR